MNVRSHKQQCKQDGSQDGAMRHVNQHTQRVHTQSEYKAKDRPPNTTESWRTDTIVKQDRIDNRVIESNRRAHAPSNSADYETTSIARATVSHPDLLGALVDRDRDTCEGAGGGGANGCRMNTNTKWAHDSVVEIRSVK